MSITYKINGITGKLDIAKDTSLLTLKGVVATTGDLPLIGNSENDCYIVKADDRIYTWNKTIPTGLITDWINVGSVSSIDWSIITNKPSSSVANIDLAVAHKDVATGNPHSVTKTEVGLGNVDNKSETTIITDVKADADVADAISKKHTQNSDTDLDATFEATFVKKTDTVNVLSDITSSGAEIEAAVTHKGVTTGNPHSVSKSDVGLGSVDNVQQLPASYLDTDTALAANSDVKVASQKATKTYIDLLLAANDAMVYKGVIDCSGNPNYPAGSAGHTYRISIAGKIGGALGVNVEVGDFAMCNTDDTIAGDQATVGAYWNVIQTNLDGAVIGCASVVDSNLVAFDGATGKLIKDSLLTYTNVADAVSKKHTSGADTSLGVLTSNISILKIDPEIRLTDSGNSEHTRIIKSDTLNVATRYNRVESPAGTISDLLAQYNLNDNLATKVVLDASGNGKTAATIINTNLMSVVGKINRAFNINGSDTRYTTLPAIFSEDPTEFSITAWAKEVTPGAEHCMVGYTEEGITIWMVLVSNTFKCYLYTSGGLTSLSSSAIADTTIYHHYAVTVKANDYMRMYIDGVEISSSLATTTFAQTGTLARLIGQRPGGVSIWDNIIDDVRFYGKVLSLGDILGIYNSGTGTENNISEAQVVEVPIWSSQDGSVAGEEGVLTIGYANSKLNIVGQSINMGADINMDTHQLTGLSTPDASGEAIRQTATITEVNLESAVDLKHTQNSDTDLDATFEATFVKKTDTVNVLSDITSAGADIEDAVSKKHTQNTDLQLDSGVVSVDGSDNITFTQNAVAAFTAINAGAVVNTLYLIAGKVGIGESSPDEKLHISSTAISEPFIKLENINDNATSGGLLFHKISISPANEDELGEFLFAGRDSAANITTYGDFSFYSAYVTDGDESGKMRIRLLQDAVIRNFLEMSGYNGVVGQGFCVINEDGVDIDFRVEAVGQANALFVQGSNGFVGIGTAAPTSFLQVVGLPIYANNAAAVAGGLTAGAFYRTNADPDPVCVVH